MGRAKDEVGEFNFYVAEELRSLRAVSMIEFEELSELSGISVASLRRAFINERTITIHHLEMLAKVFMTTPVEILLGAERRKALHEGSPPELDTSHFMGAVRELRTFLAQNQAYVESIQGQTKGTA